MASTTVFPHVDDHFILCQRAELSGRRLSYREQLQRLRAATEELVDADSEPDLGDDEGFAEAGTLRVERDRILALEAIARQRVEEVEAALQRLAAGTYGACKTCRQPIPVARLEAVPEATECVSCASGSIVRRRQAG